MQPRRKRYPEDHWLRSHDSEKALEAYLEQQSKSYSVVKNNFIGELLGDLSGKRFLDYGCGAGMFSVHAAKQGALEVIGVDAEDTVLATARFFANREGVGSRCVFIRSDNFPRLSRTSGFDVILLKDVIEHVSDDQALIETAARHLTPGGIMVLSTQNSLSLNYLIEGTYHRKVLGDETWQGWDDTHLRFYTSLSLSRMLRKAGLEPQAWRSVYIIPHKIPKPGAQGKAFYRIEAFSWLDKALGAVFPYNRLGWNIIVSAQDSGLVQSQSPSEPVIKRVIPAAPVSVNRESVHLK
jgi:2-polyprenyl-3-methyl-5-hydroxy-6-metoxy-1,4-benzoquinol methylase